MVAIAGVVFRVSAFRRRELGNARLKQKRVSISVPYISKTLCNIIWID